MHLPTTIKHIVVVSKEAEYNKPSYFQGFSTEILVLYEWVFQCLSLFPHDILELKLTGKNLVKFKNILGQLDVFVIREDLLSPQYLELGGYFNVLWSTELTWDATEDVKKKFNYEPIHISSSSNAGSLCNRDLDESKVSKLLNDQLILANRDTDFKNYFDHIIDELGLYSDEGSEEVYGFDSINHSCVKPLICTLNKFGLLENKKTIEKIDNQYYIETISKLTMLVDQIREESDINHSVTNNELIAYCPSIFTYLYDMKRWNSQIKKLSKHKRGFIRDVLVRNRGYSNAKVKGYGNEINLYQDEFIAPLLTQRQMELNLFTKIVSVIAVNQFCPAIRFSHGVMLNQGILKMISNLVKGSNSKIKLSRKLADYSNLIKQSITPQLVDLSFKNRKKILAVCDFPIEWINLEGLPIMFTHEISRIPCTPGNLLIQMGLGGQKIQLHYESFKSILIIRSFSKHDSIRNNVSDAIEVYIQSGQYKNIDINIIDVESESEVYEALKNHDGAIVIFDCHGGHGGTETPSWLMIGKHKVSFDNSIFKSIIPPIVILSACSTHPIDGSHASVANSMFGNGALSVLGTYAPIKSNHASIFVARILHRISEYMPLISDDSPITWRKIISDFFKMSYCRDVLTILETDLKLISSEQYKKIHFDVNMLINTDPSEWYQSMKNMLKDECDLTDEELGETMLKNFQYVDSMLYVQLGRPENIIIYQ